MHELCIARGGGAKRSTYGAAVSALAVHMAAVQWQSGGSTTALRRQYDGFTAAVRRQYGGGPAAVRRQYVGPSTPEATGPRQKL